MQVDKVARIWINYFLSEAAAKSKNEKIKAIIDCAVKLPDSTDGHIIRIVLADMSDDGDPKPFDQGEWERKMKISKLNSRIAELQKFRKLNEYLIRQFQEELNSLKRDEV